MKAPKQQKQFTIKEFQWYEVQTKVRQIMADLLQPFNKKQTEQTIKMNEMKRNLALITKKLEQYDFLLERQNATKPKYIQIQDEKIQQMEKIILQHKSTTNTDIKKMEVTMQVYEQKITQLNQLEKRVDHQVLQRVQNFKKYKEHVDESINLMMKKIQSEQDEMNLLKSSTRTQMNKLQSKMVSFDNRLKDLQDQVKRKTSQINRLVQESINHNEKIIKVELKLIDVVNRTEERQKDVKLSQKFFGKVKQVQNDLQFIHRYLQAYQPLYVQMQISQALDIIVKGSQRRKLCLFQEKRFAKFHNHILLNDANNLQDLMSTFSNNIRKIINRNRKYIINLKVQQSIKYGANIYEFRDDSEGNNYHDQQDQDQNKKQVNIIIPEKDIETILQKKWANMLPEVTVYVQNQIKPTRQWMKQIQEQSILRLVDNQKKLDSIKQKIGSIQAQQDLTQKHYSSEVLSLKEKALEQQERNELVRSYIKDILNFNSVLNHIVIQDQIDRQGTALYALKSGKQQNQNKISPTIQLDPSCVNCDQKTSNIINQAFKMACLAYNPSEIRIDDQYFSREQILEISTNILERLKKKLDGIQQKKSSKVLTRGKEQQQNGHQRTQRQRKSQTIVVKDPKDSGSFSRTNRNLNKTSAKSIDKQKSLQTMLPALSSSSKRNRLDVKERSTHLSVFY